MTATGLAGLAVIVMIGSLPALAHAQSDMDPWPLIPVHPDVPTIIHLPEDIERAWLKNPGEIILEATKRKLYIITPPDAPADLEAFISVKTRTLHRMFMVFVVERVEDAVTEVVVPPLAAPEPGKESVGDTPQKPTASEPAPRPAELTPTAASTEPEPAEPDLAVAASDLPRFDLSVHAVAALAGVTTVDVAGYAPKQGQQSHRAIGLRLAAAPRGAWWSAEVGISGERLDTPTVHVRDHEDMEQEERRMNGSWLRADVGMRVRSGKNWMPTAHVGLGLQAHLRSIEKSLLRENAPPESLHSEERMLCRAVLVLGMGLQYKGRNVLLGIDFQMRQGVPTDYRSVATTLSVGVFLDQGE